jgi:NADH-quinone oxidoreductase subunit C
MTIPAPLHDILGELPDISAQATTPRRVRVDAKPENLPALLELLKGRLGFFHLSAISCVDWLEEGQFELVYHVWSQKLKIILSAHIRIPRDPGEYVSIYDLHEPAGFFERDIHEMFGVVFDGALSLDKFILTSWDGPPPMRKDFNARAYAEETFSTVNYRPGWLKDIEAEGGGLEE